MTKYTEEILQEAVDSSTSIMGVLRLLGLRPVSGNHAHIRNRINGLNIDTSHFLGQRQNAGKIPSNRKPASEVLVLGSEGDRRTPAYRLRRALLEIGRQYMCEECGNEGEYNGKPLLLEVDHISGRYYDNRPESIRFLCPNCHSQQETSSSSSLKPVSGPKKSKPTECSECRGAITRHSTTGRCSLCANAHNAKKRVGSSRIDWPDMNVLINMVENSGWSATADRFGSSANGVKKHMVSRGVDPLPDVACGPRPKTIRNAA